MATASNLVRVYSLARG